ncbi:hypothetical protein GCM10023144_23020 [Pigmentiphaga soli]|uniref:Uncharacterized protein n=1 Tax=Pigmentiphaga soli TaxID=1007095 RepID=A0ABP8H0L9_9BURK
MVTPKFEPEAVTPSTPLNDTPVAVACRLVQVRVASVRAVISASANSTPVISKPSALPSRPAEASRLRAPSVSRSTAMGMADSSSGVPALSASTTEPTPLCSAKSPLALKKPATSSRPPVTATSCRPDDRPPPKVYAAPAALIDWPLPSWSVLFQRTLAVVPARCTLSPSATSMPPLASSSTPGWASVDACTSRPTEASVTPTSKAPERSATIAWEAMICIEPPASLAKAKSPLMTKLPEITARRPYRLTAGVVDAGRSPKV